MTVVEHHAYDEQRNGQPNERDEDWMMMEDVLTGADCIDISHAGGEFAEVAQAMEDELMDDYKKR